MLLTFLSQFAVVLRTLVDLEKSRASRTNPEVTSITPILSLPIENLHAFLPPFFLA